MPDISTATRSPEYNDAETPILRQLSIASSVAMYGQSEPLTPDSPPVDWSRVDAITGIKRPILEIERSTSWPIRQIAGLFGTTHPAEDEWQTAKLDGLKRSQYVVSEIGEFVGLCVGHARLSDNFRPLDTDVVQVARDGLRQGIDVANFVNGSPFLMRMILANSDAGIADLIAHGEAGTAAALSRDMARFMLKAIDRTRSGS